MTHLDPNLIAALIKAHSAAADPVALAAAIVQAHETRAQIVRLDRDEKEQADECAKRRSAIAAERRAVQERCGHPVVKQLWNGHSHDGRECEVCGQADPQPKPPTPPPDGYLGEGFYAGDHFNELDLIDA